MTARFASYTFLLDLLFCGGNFTQADRQDRHAGSLLYLSAARQFGHRGGVGTLVTLTISSRDSLQGSTSISLAPGCAVQEAEGTG